jgi:hypothetical protein
MFSLRTTRALLTSRRPARFAAVAAATMAFSAGGATAALAADAHFVPEATEAGWDGTVATVSFQEVEVPLEGATTISVKVTVDVKVVCTKGQSTLDIRKSSTALEVAEYPVGDDGTVTGTAKLPLEVRGLQVPGYSCETRHLSITAALEDFWTDHRAGRTASETATDSHTSDPPATTCTTLVTGVSGSRAATASTGKATR